MFGLFRRKLRSNQPINTSIQSQQDILRQLQQASQNRANSVNHVGNPNDITMEMLRKNEEMLRRR